MSNPAGIGGADHTDAAALDAGFRTALLLAAGLPTGAGLVSSLLVRRPRAPPDRLAVERLPVERLPVERLPVERCHHCGTSAPQAHPA